MSENPLHLFFVSIGCKGVSMESKGVSARGIDEKPKTNKDPPCMNRVRKDGAPSVFAEI